MSFMPRIDKGKDVLFRLFGAIPADRIITDSCSPAYPIFILLDKHKNIKRSFRTSNIFLQDEWTFSKSAWGGQSNISLNKDTHYCSTVNMH